MAIATLAGVESGLMLPRQIIKGGLGTQQLGRGRTTWATAGLPAAGSYDNTLNGVALTGPVVGQIDLTDPVGGARTYLAALQAAGNIEGTLMLLDRLWHNGGYTITATTAQLSTTPTWPARDIAGSTNGDGVLLFAELSAGAGAAAPTITCSYTNQAGTPGRTGTNIWATANSPATGSTYLIGLDSGDTGVRSLESVTLSTSWLSGTMNMVAARLIAMLDVRSPAQTSALDAITGAFPRLYDGSVPYLLWFPSATSGVNLSAALSWAQG